MPAAIAGMSILSPSPAESHPPNAAVLRGAIWLE
jgi:hypothetical protein